MWKSYKKIKICKIPPGFQQNDFVLVVFNVRFAENRTCMNSIDDKYATLERLLCEEQIFLNPGIRFPEICSWLQTKETDMDGLVRRELGLGGEELLRLLRESFPGRLCRKYGINVPVDTFF